MCPSSAPATEATAETKHPSAESISMDSNPSIWSEAQSPRLLASRSASGALRFPPFSPTSPLGVDAQVVQLPEIGEVYSFTWIHPNPKLGELPFALGYVNFEGARVFGRIRGTALKIGTRCAAVQDDAYEYVFELKGE
jgi:uncharacterized protein